MIATLWDAHYQAALFSLSLSMDESKRVPKDVTGSDIWCTCGVVVEVTDGDGDGGGGGSGGGGNGNGDGDGDGNVSICFSYKCRSW